MTVPEYKIDPPRRRRGLALLVAAAVIVGIGWSVGIDIQERFVVGIQTILMNRYANDVDRSLIDAAAGNGIFIRFLGFEGHQRGYCTNLYFRANYILFPNRVLVGDPSAPINTADQILAANFLPTDKWLLDHQTPTVVTYACRVDPLTRTIDFRYAVRHVNPTTRP
jgi:hypothetical protein